MPLYWLPHWKYTVHTKLDLCGHTLKLVGKSPMTDHHFELPLMYNISETTSKNFNLTSHFNFRVEEWYSNCSIKVY